MIPPIGSRRLIYGEPQRTWPNRSGNFPLLGIDDLTYGNQYNWHRYYDPSLGRYISADPIGQLGGANTYNYVTNNPINAVDPTGLTGSYLSRVGQNFSTTNTAVPGALARVGLGVVLGAGGSAASALESTTFVAWAASGFGSATMGAATFTAAETAGIVAGTHAIAFATVALSYEAGVGIGSFASELPVLGGGTVGDFWGELLFGAYESALGRFDDQGAGGSLSCEDPAAGSAATAGGSSGGFHGFL